MRYRRYYRKGGYYFFTLTLHNRQLSLLTDHIGLLRQAFQAVQTRHPFKIIAIVVLPEHLHCIWKLPNQDANYSQRWNQIKGHFSKSLKKVSAMDSHFKNNIRHSIWQNRYWEHCIRDDHDLYRHVEYIHNNPVKHGYVTSATDWPHSSIHKFNSGPP